ncbi:hypothetical protein K470DRAFT_271284 [Piedraia hortae CBS 480.64]|uniref:Uncharacterized protein n=1 Tax=Piedraia hortae CBS 480.64 TaxID=1314780 RepID=A0A6A7BWW7_9PEZI|nr:hypothetical protein K470DRAFT_271284 [Piedraia hortae CBS 480.64]
MSAFNRILAAYQQDTAASITSITHPSPTAADKRIVKAMDLISIMILFSALRIGATYSMNIMLRLICAVYFCSVFGFNARSLACIAAANAFMVLLEIVHNAVQ